MLETCRHSNCAVCKSEEDRNIFEFVFKKKHPDMFFCENAMYKITNASGEEIILTSLDRVSKGNKGYFIYDITKNSSLIYLNKINFKVLCTSTTGCNAIIPHVEEYVPRHKKSSY